MNEKNKLKGNELISLNLKQSDFDFLMGVYDKALSKVLVDLRQVKELLAKAYGYDVINNISGRLKTPDSIANKMVKKHYEISFENIIQNINDVAGVRITCPVKADIYNIAEIISHMQNIEIIEVKDYIKNPKKSGYSGYHIIVKTPVNVQGQEVMIKVEIQIRTMAMDFWATNEHKIRYKGKNKLSALDSKKLTAYAKIINSLDESMGRIFAKQEIA